MISIGNGSGPYWLMFQRYTRHQSSLCNLNHSSIRTHSISLEIFKTYIKEDQNLVITIDFHIGKI